MLIEIENFFNREEGDGASERSLIEALAKKHLGVLVKSKYPAMDLTSKGSMKRDRLAYLVLFLAFGTMDETRAFFLRNEIRLFKARVMMADVKPHTALGYVLTTGVVRRASDEDFITDDEVLQDWGAATAPSVDRARLTNVLIGDASLLHSVFRWSRDVLLYRGKVYIPDTSALDVLLEIGTLTLTANHVIITPAAIRPDRNMLQLIQDLKDMSVRNLEMEYDDKASGKMALKEFVDVHATRDLPPCIRHLYMTLTTRYKLFHDGRLQFYLFLKSIGVSCEDTTHLMREYMTKQPDLDINGFTKNYLYNIRHAYGKEGSRKSYGAMSCTKTMALPRATGSSVHGCPLAHMPFGVLQDLLPKMYPRGVDMSRMGLIKGNIEAGNPQNACQEVFKATHPARDDDAVTKFSDAAAHPRSWMEASAGYYEDMEDMAGKR